MDVKAERSFAQIHLDHLSHNYQLAKQSAGNAQIMAVVKADAYGHGAVACSKHLQTLGCRHFAVACLREALELREHGIDAEILIFGRTDPANAELLSKHRLVQTIYSLDYAKALNEAALPLFVHINIDTGMSRFGLYYHQKDDLDQVIQDIREMKSLEHLQCQGIYTHFANSDEIESSFCHEQYQRFDLLLKVLKREGIEFKQKHVSNSGAMLAHPDISYDLVRTGISLYGYPPVKTLLDFRPVLQLFSQITSVRTLHAGDTVSYGRTYQANATERIATVACGYADGYFRSLSNRDYLIVKDQKCPVIGRVCMDAMMIRVDDLDVKDGDVVEIFGLKKPLLDICRTLETIPYEPLCRISKRVPRIYLS